MKIKEKSYKDQNENSLILQEIKTYIVMFILIFFGCKCKVTLFSLCTNKIILNHWMKIKLMILLLFQVARPLS